MLVRIKTDIGQILRKLCGQKSVEINEAEVYRNHIHMLVCVPTSLSVSQFMKYLKEKSSLMILDRYANLKYKFGNRHLRAERYYVSTVGLNTAAIQKYIRDQEKDDQIMDKLNVKEYSDSFKGSK